MAKVEKISIALPPEMVGAVRDAVVSGEYASTSEVIRDALRDWTLKRKMAIVELDEMRRLVREGIESGPGVDADLVFDARRGFDRLTGWFFRRARKRISKRSATTLHVTIRRGRSPFSTS